MRKAISILLAIAPLLALADAVRWGGATITNGGVYCSKPVDGNYIVQGAEIIYTNPETFETGYEGPEYYLQGYFSVSISGDTTTIKGVGHALSGSDVFVKMEMGEVISALTTFYSDEVFYRYGYLPEEEQNYEENFREIADYSIDIPSYSGEHFFLGFGTASYTVDGQPCLYGWLEIAVNGTELSIVNSAIGLNGQSMTVGLIPEPTTTMLLLLGLAPLALRRRLATSDPIL
ncbi:MAG: PEP-CTERM sorting domain-containing protein [Kiritimatiellae bacterium]|nr:PEP-CTERM sorting domain-containing protein [Kiritimatiellia bacterium]